MFWVFLVVMNIAFRRSITVACVCLTIAHQYDTLNYSKAFSANTKHLYNICTTSTQRLRRWPNIVQMLYKCFCGC